MQIPEMPSMEVYESVMQTTLEKLKNQGVTHSILEILTSKTYVNTGKTN
jgi:hypothetical protein